MQAHDPIFFLFKLFFMSYFSPGLQNPVDAIYHLQPLMFLGLFPLFLYNEGEKH